jgi:hypothetical protein
MASKSLALLEAEPDRASQEEAVRLLNKDDHIWKDRRGSDVIRSLASIASGHPVGLDVLLGAIHELSHEDRWMTFEDSESISDYRGVVKKMAAVEALQLFSNLANSRARVVGSPHQRRSNPKPRKR